MPLQLTSYMVILLVCFEQTQNRPAYHLASDLVRSTVDALEPYIQTVRVLSMILFCHSLLCL